MSVELCSVSGSGLNQDGVQATTLGGSKPLHRFLRGQPKITGNSMLVLGTSFFIITIAVMMDFHSMDIWPYLPPILFMGIQFIACGILYILTEYNPTKKTVTISLALSITSLLGVVWTFIDILPLINYHAYRAYETYDDDNGTIQINTQEYPFNNMIAVFEAILLFYTMVGAVIVIVMSCLAGAALRSTKTQAVIVMTAALTETPAGI
ncbi:uncharacterized protein LOC114459228 [Gouania willdenowi]|uniref:Uncharacterized LOC114460099 n=1 Tax=Gouania willdenowi TaxID=441366 RepID=A0A8C5EIN3_GOUWI|nr:uncharacterized protein LOC114459228 [Gouania willdenowi]